MVDRFGHELLHLVEGYLCVDLGVCLVYNKLFVHNFLEKSWVDFETVGQVFEEIFKAESQLAVVFRWAALVQLKNLRVVANQGVYLS